MFEDIKKILAERVAKDIEITEESILLSDLGLNSYELVSMVCELEDTFDIEVPDEDIRGFVTVKDIIEYIKTKRA